MSNPLPKHPDDAREMRHRIEHDLCGPLITARGFLTEVIEVRAELGQWMADNRESLSALDGGAMERLLEEEFDVCTTYLEKALSQFDERVLTLSRTLATPSETNKLG